MLLQYSEMEQKIIMNWSKQYRSKKKDSKGISRVVKESYKLGNSGYIYHFVNFSSNSKFNRIFVMFSHVNSEDKLLGETKRREAITI